MSTAADDRLLAKLEELRARYQTVGEDMGRPEIAGNPIKIVELNKEHGRLRRTLDPYLAYCRAMAEAAEARTMAADPASEPDLREMAEQEAGVAQARAVALLDEIRTAMVTSEDAVISSIIMEIRAGTGGDEAALFAGDLCTMYQRYAEQHRFSVEIMDSSPSEIGGYREVVLNIKGEGVYRQLGYEGGGHRVQRVPETESQGRIHTSAATVAVLPEPEEVEVQIDWEKDVIEHVSRAGGPGGQNVNKVSSAIRLEHLPTGITVSMRDEKSQHKNRAKARRILITRVYDQIVQGQRAQRDASRKSMIGSGDRSQRIRTYNFPQNRCTDHRIGLDMPLERVMQGELDDLIAALQARDVEERLKNL